MTNLSSDSMRTSTTLLRGVRDPQNHEAWEKFIARYGPMIRGWCRQWFPREADDKAYEVFSELVFRMINFEYDPGKGRFRGWLKTVTHNLMAKFKRELPPQVDDDQNPLDSARSERRPRSAAGCRVATSSSWRSPRNECERRVATHTLAGVCGDSRRRAEAGRGRSRTRHESRHGLSGKAQRHRSSCGGRSRTLQGPA